MTNLELVLNMLAEATTTEISKEKKPKTFKESQKIAKQGGTIELGGSSLFKRNAVRE